MVLVHLYCLIQEASTSPSGVLFLRYYLLVFISFRSIISISIKKLQRSVKENKSLFVLWIDFKAFQKSRSKILKQNLLDDWDNFWIWASFIFCACWSNKFLRRVSLWHASWINRSSTFISLLNCLDFWLIFGWKVHCLCSLSISSKPSLPWPESILEELSQHDLVELALSFSECKFFLPLLL